MDKKQIEDLLEKFNTGRASADELKVIEQWIEGGIISLEQIEDLRGLEDQLMRLEHPSSSPALDRRFYEMLGAEKAKKKSVQWIPTFSWQGWSPKLALGGLTLIVGLAAGYFLRPAASSSGSHQIERLSQQVSELQEMMMLSLLEKGSATERLKAVNLTQEMSEASRKVTAALIHTLNEDENVNVRLAALEALKPYAADSSVREALIRSIGRQESPLVQVSLAELMVALQEKSAVKEFEKLVESEKTPEAVKKKIRESINVLI